MATTTTVATLPTHNNNNGTTTTNVFAVPAGLDEIVVQVNCTTGNPASPFQGFQKPFNSPSMSVTFGAQWSWDGGTTFLMSTETSVSGSPTGSWGTDKLGNPLMTPEVGLGLPSIAAQGGPPNAFRGYMTVSGGPITFGLTVLQTVG